jgi:DNA-binding XRE family transcriptional regulator
MQTCIERYILWAAAGMAKFLPINGASTVPFWYRVPSKVYTNGGALKLDRDRLQRARELLGYGLEKTAEEAGISKNSVLRAEHEEDIRPVTARKIAAALDVPVADLIGESETLKAQPPLPDFWGKWRSQLELLESCVQHKVSRAEYYERELERGRSSDYATARGAENLAILAREEFAGFTKWVIDGPVRPLAIALEQVPSPVDPRIAEEFEAKVDVMIYRAKQTTDLLFGHAYHLAETAEKRNELAKKRQQVEKLEKRAARGEMRSA